MSDQHPAADVKLPVLDQHWPLDVLLKNERLGLDRLALLRCDSRISERSLDLRVFRDKFFHLIKCGEQSDTSTAIVIIRFQYPHIFLTPHSFFYFVRFLPVPRHFIKKLIHRCTGHSAILLEYIEVKRKLVKSMLHRMLLCDVDHEGQRHTVPHRHLRVELTKLVKILEQKVFLTQILVVLKVINKSLFAKYFVFDLLGVAAPFEVK